MEKRVLFAIAIASMLAIALVPIIGDESSDATNDTTYGQFNFWIYNETTDSWDGPYTGTGFDAAVALKDACADNNIPLTFKTIDNIAGDDYIYTVPGAYPYDTINTNYGTIDTINGNSNYSAYYYSTDNTWKNAYDQIGFYRPYSDYDPDFTTANMAFGPSDEVPAITQGLKPIVNVVDNADFMVTFHVKVDPKCADDYYGNPTISMDELISGVDLVGYGSSVYAALLDAAGSAIVGNSSVTYTDSTGKHISTQYGYFTDAFGLEYRVEPGTPYDTYYYWSTYSGNGTTNYCNFMFGYYSPLAEVTDSNILCGSEFTLYYTY